MKKIVLAMLMSASVSGLAQTQLKVAETPGSQTGKQDTKMNTIYDFTVKDIEGKDFKMSSLKGKKVIIVNTASECGFTPQYQDLEELYRRFKDHNLVIIGFPSNDFGKQEPGDNKEIAAFCKKNYGVTFPMMSKISVTGKDMAPIYHFLTEKAKNGVDQSNVEWNFQKYLIDENGRLVKVIPSKIRPLDEQIISWVKS